MKKNAVDALELCADAVDFSFGSQQILYDVSLTIRPGMRVGIVGESGSGKTTLARLLTGVLVDGVQRVTVNGQSWSEVSRRSPTRRAVQMVFQDPFASLNPYITAQSAVQEALAVCRGVPRREAAGLAAELLGSVGIGSAAAGRRPGNLSGGQCQRVAIARALAAQPRVLVADEPTSALDLSVQAQIVNLLLDVMSDRRVALVLVSHDLAVVRHLSEELVVMKHGRIVERGPTQKLMSNPENPYTRQLVAAALR